MEMPEEFKALVKQANDPAMTQAYAGLGETPVQFFFNTGFDKKVLKRLDAYLAYVLEHPDNGDKTSALWRDIDGQSRFGGVKTGLKLFTEARREIRRRL